MGCKHGLGSNIRRNHETGIIRCSNWNDDRTDICGYIPTEEEIKIVAKDFCLDCGKPGWLC